MVAAAICMILAPKVNLVTFPGMNGGIDTAGIRVDDILLGLIGWIVALTFVRGLKRDYTALEKKVLAFSLAGLFSNAINKFFFDRSNFLYSLRIVECFVFFYLGRLFAMRGRLINLIWAILGVNGVAMLLQRVGVLGAFSSEGFRASNTARPDGMTGGPWEVGAVINICFGVIAFDPEKRRSGRFVFGVFVITFGLILLTAARMPTVAHIVLLMLFIYNRSRNKLLFTAQAVVALVCVGLAASTSTVTRRSANTFSTANMEALASLYRDTKPVKGQMAIHGNRDTPQTEGADFSAAVRAISWGIAVKTWLADDSSIAIGVGPGTFGPALDGGWLRWLTESGLVGFVLLLALLAELWSINGAMKAAVISLATSMIAIDMPSYKVSTLIYFCAGYYLIRQSAGNRRTLSVKKTALAPIPVAQPG
jgi:hypothetical protein